MSDYRSDLRAAKERIEQLEIELKGARAPLDVGMRKDQVFSPARILLSVILLVPLMLGGAVATCAITKSMSKAGPAVVVTAPPAVATTSTTPLLPLPPHLRWYEEPSRHGGGPLFLSINNMIIGWMRDDARLADNLRVVAIDRDTFQTRWSSRPIAGIPAASGSATTKDVLHLAFVPPSWIVATDARGFAIVFRERDGVEIARHFVGELGVEEICAVGTASQAFLALDARYWRPRYPGDVGQTLNPVEMHRQKTFLLDVEHGTLRPAPLSTFCARDCQSPGGSNEACRLARAEVPQEGSLSADGATTWIDGDIKVSIGPTFDGVRLLSAVGATTTTPAAGTTKGKDSKWAWTSPIPTRENPEERGSKWLVTVKGHFVYVLYQTTRGPWRIVSLDVKTGARLYELEVPSSNTGSRMQSLSVDQKDIFLAMNDELYVLDSSSGTVRTRIQVSPGEAEARLP